MDSDKEASMYADIVLGKTKKQSIYCKGKEASDIWDEIALQVAALRKSHPNAHFQIPHELP